MQQAQLWNDGDETAEEAASASVKAAGGVKKVAGKVWPAMDSEKAATKLRGCLSAEHLQKPDFDEIGMLIRLAREEADDISLLQWFARHANCQVTRLTPVEAKRNARKARKAMLLAELGRLLDEEE